MIFVIFIYRTIMFKLILLRHGESQLNKLNCFGGWIDVDLTKKGLLEAAHAAQLLQTSGLSVDVVHTSNLLRSIKTANEVLF